MGLDEKDILKFMRTAVSKAKPKLNRRKRRRPVDPAYKLALRKNIEYIAANMSDLVEIKNLLMEKSLLTEGDIEEIDSYPRTSKKIYVIINIFCKKGYEAFETFKDILRKTGHDDIDSTLREDEAAAKKKAKEKQDEYMEAEVKRIRQKMPKKKGKLFSIYEASDDESSSDEDEEKEFDAGIEDPDYDTIINYFIYVEEFLKDLNYDISRTYKLERFKVDSYGNGGIPENNVIGGLVPTCLEYRQRFMVDRPIFLIKVGFYGPETAASANYEIKAQVTNWPYTDTILAQNKVVLEGTQGEIMDINFKKYFEKTEDVYQQYLNELEMRHDYVVPIKPHVWHMIRFKIRGQYPIKCQLLTRDEREKRAIPIADGVALNNIVEFNFGTIGCYSSGYLAQFVFHPGKKYITSNTFHKTPGCIAKVPSLFSCICGQLPSWMQCCGYGKQEPSNDE